LKFPHWLTYTAFEFLTLSFDEQWRFSFHVLSLKGFQRRYSLFEVSVYLSAAANIEGYVLRVDFLWLLGLVRMVQRDRFYKKHRLADQQMKHIHLYLGEFMLKKNPPRPRGGYR
jgi:hypothetical protein